MSKQKIILNIFNTVNIDKIIKIIAAVLLLFFLTTSLSIAITPDYRDYYFKGTIDLKKYPQFRNCGYKEGIEVQFNIYDNKIFAECESEYGSQVSVKINDGIYDFVTEDGIKIRITSANGKIADFITNNNKELKDKKKLNFKNDSCKIAGFISNFHDTYQFKEFQNGYGINYKQYSIGSNARIIDGHEIKDDYYDFSSFFINLYRYKGEILVSNVDINGSMQAENGIYCAKVFNPKKKELIIIDCDTKKKDIYLKWENCIITEYSGQFESTNN